MVESDHAKLSIEKQCHLLGIHRSGYYYQPRPESETNLALMRLLDEQYMRTPFYGARRLHESICSLGYDVNIKRIRRLMRLMGLEAIYPKPNISRALKGHKIYPYLLNGLQIDRVNQVWSTDITFIPMRNGFMYLTAIIDWFSRFVLSWTISNSLDATFCVEALLTALAVALPEIFNSDQGSQFSSDAFTSVLENAQIAISMDSRGRALDNIFIERLWRSVKYEYVYLNAPSTGSELWQGLCDYFQFYNYQRPHQALGYRTPAMLYGLQKVLDKNHKIYQVQDNLSHPTGSFGYPE
jgi:putative transposase